MTSTGGRWRRPSLRAAPVPQLCMATGHALRTRRPHDAAAWNECLYGAAMDERPWQPPASLSCAGSAAAGRTRRRPRNATARRRQGKNSPMPCGHTDRETSAESAEDYSHICKRAMMFALHLRGEMRHRQRGATDVPVADEQYASGFCPSLIVRAPARNVFPGRRGRLVQRRGICSASCRLAGRR